MVRGITSLMNETGFVRVAVSLVSSTMVNIVNIWACIMWVFRVDVRLLFRVTVPRDDLTVSVILSLSSISGLVYASRFMLWLSSEFDRYVATLVNCV